MTGHLMALSVPRPVTSPVGYTAELVRRANAAGHPTLDVYVAALEDRVVELQTAIDTHRAEVSDRDPFMCGFDVALWRELRP